MGSRTAREPGVFRTTRLASTTNKEASETALDLCVLRTTPGSPSAKNAEARSALRETSMFLPPHPLFRSAEALSAPGLIPSSLARGKALLAEMATPLEIVFPSVTSKRYRCHSRSNFYSVTKNSCLIDVMITHYKMACDHNVDEATISGNTVYDIMMMIIMMIIIS